MLTLELSCELYRISTFSTFPANIPVSERNLAKAGFYYTGVNDQVKCFSCGLMLENWKKGDHAFEKHKRLYPSCSFIQNTSPVNPETLVFSSFSTPSSLNSQIQPSSSTPSSFFVSVTPNFEEDLYSLGNNDHNSYMYTAEARLRTFKNWPITFLNPSELSKAGFYYIGPGDKVACFACNGKINNWEPNDNALTKHRMHFPDCSFVRPSANPPLNISSVYMQYLSSRLKTFVNWPSSTLVTPQKMAEAGFYYVGRNDDVKCFCCDGGLRCWVSGDDPWVEHAKWFPRCQYLLHVKGQSFVQSIQNQYPHLDQLRSENNNAQNPPILRLNEESDRDDETYMNTTVVQDVLSMGFNNRLVKETIFNKILTTGENYKETADLVTDLVSAQKEQKEEEGDKQSEQKLADEQSPRSQASDDYSDLPMEEQLRRLQEERTCKICMEQEVSIVFIPCGHLIACKNCAPSLRRCPVCRGMIKGTVRTFLS